MKTRPIFKTALVVLFTAALSIGIFAAPGDLDPTFNNTGLMQTSTRVVNSSLPTNLLAVQPDGMILTAANISPDGNYFQTIITRMNPSGTRDLTFGSDGAAVISDSPAGYFYDEALALALQPDGKILITGTVRTNSSERRYICATTRLNADGSRDHAFGSGGWLLVQTDGDCWGRTITLANDGAILIGGFSVKMVQGQIAITWVVARYNGDGSTDASFGQNGVLTFTPAETGGTLIGVAIKPDGKIMVAGNVSVHGQYGNSELGLLKLNADGSPDQTFGVNGYIVATHGAISSYIGATLQPDGKLVTVGSNTELFALVRVNEDGSIDNSFGNNGVSTVPPIFGTQYANNLVLQNDGKILVGGRLHVNGRDDFGVVRFNNDGSIDKAPTTSLFGRKESFLNGPYWGTNGVASAGFPLANELLWSMALDSAGRVIVLGDNDSSVLSYFTMARFQGDSSPFATLRVSVTDRNGAPVRNIPVTIQYGDLPEPVTVKSKVDGYAVFPNLPVTENYDVSISGRGGQLQSTLITNQSIMLNQDSELGFVVSSR